MNDPSYNEREAARSRNNPMFHSTACLETSVDAFCDSQPDPGCTCGRTAAIQCQWFALCANVASRERSHPILGSVPICVECDNLIAAMS